MNRDQKLFYTYGINRKLVKRFKGGKLVDDGIFYVNREDEENMSRRIREIEYFNGSLWIAGYEKGIAEISLEQKR